MLAQPSIKKELLYDRCVNKYVNGMLIAIRDALAMNRDTKCNVKGAFAFPKEAVDKQIKKNFHQSKASQHLLLDARTREHEFDY